MEELFKELDLLEDGFAKEKYNIEEYYKIKKNIINHYQEPRNDINWVLIEKNIINNRISVSKGFKDLKSVRNYLKKINCRLIYDENIYIDDSNIFIYIISAVEEVKNG